METYDRMVNYYSQETKNSGSLLKAIILGCIYFSTLFSMVRIVSGISFITIFAALFCIIVLLEKILRGKIVLDRKYICVYLALYLIALTWLSYYWSDAPSVTISRNYAYTILPLYFICVEMSNINKKDIKIIDNFIMFSGIVFFIYALLTQGVGGLVSGRFSINEDTDQNATCGALFLILTVAIKKTVMLIKQRELTLYSLIFNAFVVLIISLLYFLTGSRGGLLAIATWLFLIAIKNRRGRWIRILIIGLFLVSIVLFLAPVVLPNSVYTRLFTSDSYMDTAYSEKNRVAIWQYCFYKLIPDMKAWGYGAGVPPYLVGTYFGMMARGIHNTYLCMFLEFGFLGLPAFMTFLWLLSRRTLKNGDWYCFCMIIGVIIISFFLESFPRTYFWNILTYCSVSSLGSIKFYSEYE